MEGDTRGGAREVAREDLDKSLKINEIFYSIQGESSYAGLPFVFIRTTGCHLRCEYCDTKYSYYEGEKKTVGQILQEVSKHPARHVCLTGGEPLLQKKRSGGPYEATYCQRLHDNAGDKWFYFLSERA